MPTNLPERPNLRHLKDQAKDVLKRGEASSSYRSRSFQNPRDSTDSELAEAQSACRVAGRNRRAQTGNRRE